MNLEVVDLFRYTIQLQVMHGGHLFSSYLGTSQNEATGSAVPRITVGGHYNLKVLANGLFNRLVTSNNTESKVYILSVH